MTDEAATEGSGTPPPRPPVLTLREPLPRVVDSAQALDRAAAAIAAGSGPVAVDAERASGYRYSQRAYLVQLRRAGSGVVLIDPVPFGEVPNDSLAALGAAVGDAEWVVHAASQDLPCLAELSLRPTTLFDTELAGRLLNFPRVALAVLVEELLGYSLRKEHSAVDWSRRPLPEPWLEYAALDVELLLELREELAARLVAAGKDGWAREEFAAAAAMPPPAIRREPWRRTSGIHRVRGRRGLALVRAMWERRDELARRRDLAPGRVLPDAAIVDVASAAPRSKADLAALPAMRTRGGQRHLSDFWAAVTTAQRLPERELPNLASTSEGPPAARIWANRFPEAAARLSACRAVVTAIAEEVEVPTENLIPPDSVRRLAWDPPEEPDAEVVAALLMAAGARPWQVELTAAGLTTALVSASSAPGRLLS
jgi:ribonuclease D